MDDCRQVGYYAKLARKRDVCYITRKFGTRTEGEMLLTSDHLCLKVSAISATVRIDSSRSDESQITTCKIPLFVTEYWLSRNDRFAIKKI